MRRQKFTIFFRKYGVISVFSRPKRKQHLDYREIQEFILVAIKKNFVSVANKKTDENRIFSQFYSHKLKIGFSGSFRLSTINTRNLWPNFCGSFAFWLRSILPWNYFYSRLRHSNENKFWTRWLWLVWYCDVIVGDYFLGQGARKWWHDVASFIFLKFTKFRCTVLGWENFCGITKCFFW